MKILSEEDYLVPENGYIVRGIFKTKEDAIDAIYTIAGAYEIIESADKKWYYSDDSDVLGVFSIEDIQVNEIVEL